MVKDMYSTTAIKIMSLKEGYRDDEVYGSGVEDFEAVVRFEVLELGNKDIFYTLKGYNPKVDLRKSKELLIGQVLTFYRNKFKAKKLYCKWLTSREAVLDIYGSNPVCYDFKNQRVCIASDCSDDGVLLVSDRPIREK